MPLQDVQIHPFAAPCRPDRPVAKAVPRLQHLAHAGAHARRAIARRSPIKAELAGKPAAKKPAKKKPVSKALPKAVVVAAVIPAPSTNGKRPVVSIDDVLELKAIVGRVGANSAKILIDAMSK